MRKLFIALAFLLALGSPARAADGDGLEDVEFVGLTPGTAAILRIDEAGGVSFEPGVARMAEIDKAALQEMGVRYEDPEALEQASGPNAAIMQLGKSEPAPIARDAVRISFFLVTGRNGSPEALLVLENGYDQAMRYHAVIARGQRSQPTDVCSVLPHLRGYEHWPYPLDRVDLSNIRLEPYREGTPPVCE